MCSLLLLIYAFPGGLNAIRTPESAQSQPSVLDLLRGKGAASTLTGISLLSWTGGFLSYLLFLGIE